MRTTLAFIGMTLCLFQGTLSAQTKDGKFTSLFLGKRAHLGVTNIYLRITPIKANGGFGLAIAEKSISYRPSDGSIETVVKRELKAFAIHPRAGLETAEYVVKATADWILSFESERFTLEKTLSEWKLPEKAFVLNTNYRGVALDLPTVTGFEVRIRKGNSVTVFSTITGENTVGGSCQTLVLQDDVLKGIVQLPTELVTADCDERDLTLLEGDRFVTLDRDGLVTAQSEEPPLVLEIPEPEPEAPLEPLRVGIKSLANGYIQICVTGNGHEDAVLETSEDLSNWNSSSSTYELASSEKRWVYPLSGKGFYRVRLDRTAQTSR